MRFSASLATSLCDAPVVIDFSVVAHAAQQAIDDARRAARASRNLARAFVVDLDAENLSGTFADDFEIFVRVEVEMKDDAETSAQRSGDQTGASRGADQA